MTDPRLQPRWMEVIPRDPHAVKARGLPALASPTPSREQLDSSLDGHPEQGKNTPLPRVPDSHHGQGLMALLGDRGTTALKQKTMVSPSLSPKRQDVQDQQGHRHTEMWSLWQPSGGCVSAVEMPRAARGCGGCGGWACNRRTPQSSGVVQALFRSRKVQEATGKGNVARISAFCKADPNAV